MKDRSHSGPELRLLLEEYDRPRGDRPQPSEGSASFESEPPLLLLEDYPKRVGRRHARAPFRAQPSDLPLRLLVEDFKPFDSRRSGKADRRRAAPAEPGPEPDLLVHWGDDIAASRRREARAASAVLHLALIVLALAQPYVDTRDLTDPESPRDYTQISLSAPSPEELRELTQRAPQQQGPAETFTGLKSPTTPIATPEPVIAPPEVAEPPQPVQLEPEPEPEPAPPEPEPEPEPPPAQEPTVTARAPAPGEFQTGRRPATTRVEELPLPRSPAPPKEKPKLVLEDPKATMPAPEGPIQIGELKLNQRPDQVIESAIQNLSESGGGRQAVGEGVGAGASGGYAPPSPGNIGSGLELLSDPKGVDFRPYLLQVLNSVRRNWYAVIPESARLGMERGRAAIQFSISRVGDVPKLVIASSSGSQPLDRAAVAGISASLPFPPLPGEFTGSEIRLQFVFLYNMR